MLERIVDFPSLFIHAYTYDMDMGIVCITMLVSNVGLVAISHLLHIILRQFRQLGMAIAISDFGTGDASLNYLKRFPTDAVKIEKCFVDDLGKPGGDGAMVRAIVAMAHTLGLRTVAGGVENGEQLELLAEMGCDEAFGYFLGRAMGAEGVEALLRSGAPA